MNKIILIILFIFITSFVCASDKVQIYWYLASSMKKPALEITELYNLKSSKIKVNLITGGSGQLLSKILMSKKADIYTPASIDFLNKAHEKKLIDKSYLILTQTPVFAISAESSDEITKFEDLYNKKIKIAFGKEKTMALGKLYKKIEIKMPKILAEKLRQKEVIKAINISQIVNYLTSNFVNAGILFDSTAKANHLKYIEIPKKYLVVAKVKIALLKTSKNKKAAYDFIKFLFENKNIFLKYGFNFVGEL